MTDGMLYRHVDEMAPWDDRLQMLEVVAVMEEAPEVKTFTFRSDNQTWFRYRPGQFITLELPVAEEPLFRTYTLSSSPSRPFSIAVTVKAQPDSIGTRWMFDHLKPGDHLKAYGPTGTFSHHTHPAGRYLFISAGSGVTPMMSMLRWLFDCAPWTDVAFINCARQPEDIIFRRELEFLGARMPGLLLSFLVEQRSSREIWSGLVGRLDDRRLPLMVPDFQDREVFCCGPEPFMAMVRTVLASHGFDSARYHQESFGSAQADTAPAARGAMDQPAAGAEPAESVPIRFVQSATAVDCLEGQSVLQAARASGVRIAAACELGLCGTCKVKKLSGDVEMIHNGGILDDEIDQGFILACCSKPLTPLEIEA